jgi:hypothetical protein
VATGPNFWDNLDNWDTGAAPTSADDVYVDNTDISILYNIDWANTIPSNFATLFIGQNFTGQIGLPNRNSSGYVEYRQQYLQVYPTVVTIGRGDGGGSGRIKLDGGAQVTGGTHDGASNVATLSDSGESWTADQYIGWTVTNVTDGSSGTITDNDSTTITATLSGGTDDDWDAGDAYTIDPPSVTLTIENTGSNLESGLSAVQWKGDGSSNSLVVLSGAIDVAWAGGDSSNLDTVKVTDGTCRVSAGVGTVSEVSNLNGSVHLFNTTTTALKVSGGSVTVGGSAAVGTLTARGGQVLYDSSGTITSLVVGGAGPASVEFRTNLTRTVTACTIGAGGTVRDDADTVSWTANLAPASDVRTISAG